MASSSSYTYPPTASTFAADPNRQYQYNQQQQQQQQYQQQYQLPAQPQQQLVPSYGPPGSSYSGYNNYSFAQPPPAYNYNTYASSTAATGSSNADPSIYTVQQPHQQVAATTSVTSSSNNETIDLLDDFFNSPAPSAPTAVPNAAAVPVPAAASTASTFSSSDVHARDEAFVASLSPAIIAEQQRLYDEIQKSRRLSQQNPNANHAAVTTYDSSNRELIVPPSDNPTGSDAVVPTKYEMKQARKVKIGAGAVSGAVVGGVLFGPAWPLGVVAGGAAGAIGTKALAKRHERKAQRKFEKRNVQQQASQSIVARASSTEAAAFA